MTCTTCKRRQFRPAGEVWTAADADAARAAGWFIYASGTSPRFLGVVLCPACRTNETAKDAYGDMYPTAELEDRASKARST